MKITWFIARKITSGSSREGQLSKPVVNIAVGGIILGMTVMILTIFIVKGFQTEVKDRTVAFGAHIIVTKSSNNNSSESLPLEEKQEKIEALKQDDRIAGIQQFMTKNGMIKTKTENEGVIIKGVGKNYNWGFIGEHIVSGKVLDSAQQEGEYQSLISKTISDRLGIGTGDKMFVYFLVTDSSARISYQDLDTTVKISDTLYINVMKLEEDDRPEISYEVSFRPKVKDFRITGVYETGLEDYDKKMVFTSEEALKKICRWKSNYTGGFEIYLKNFDQLDEVGTDVYVYLKSDLNLTSTTIKESNPGIFEWLDMHDTTAWIVLILMVIVSVINMISALIILIIEKVNMIGILKSMGMRNGAVMKIFLIQAGRLITKGMLWGNILGIAIAVVQYKFHLVKLDQSTYYMPFVPIKFEWFYLALLNAGTFSACILFMLLPALIVTKTTPIKAIKFG
jgi:lipoprotein-releasing system permease protein